MPTEFFSLHRQCAAAHEGKIPTLSCKTRQGWRTHTIVSVSGLELRRVRFCFLEGDSLLFLVREVRHVDGDGRAVPNFDRSVRGATGADAVDPVLHVVLVWGLALHRFAGGTVGFFRPV